MVYLKERNVTYENLKKKIIFENDTAIKMAQYINEAKNQNLHDLFIETFSFINLCPDINKFKLQIFDSLAPTIFFARLSMPM